MPKYLVQGTYTEQGLKGIVKDGGSKRREVVEQLITGMGGKLEAFYFAFGGDDLFIIADVPSSADAVSLALTANASGPLPLRDSFTGAIARSRGYSVVTRDVAPFERMGCKVLNPWQ